MPFDHTDVTGCVLAGGRGSRLGGLDKGLLPLAGRPLVAHVLTRFAPQVGPLVISANRNQALYAALGPRVVGDETQDYAGPLAGIAAALAVTTTRWLACVPCDAPFLPADLVARLFAACAAADADVACVTTGGLTQPVFALIAAACAPDLAAYLARGARKTDGFYRERRMVTVEFGAHAETDAFMNLNTDAELAAAAARLAPAC